MAGLKQHSGLVVPLDAANVDTDAIIPKQFLQAITRVGFGKHLFHEWRYGIKSYYGNANRPEVLHTAGIEQAELLIVAIDNKKQTTHIVEMAKKMNPNIKVIARAYDRSHVFELYQAGADKQVRETFDSAVRGGTLALRLLGIDKDVANEIGKTYFRRDRHRVRLMAEMYDPSISIFQNKEMIKIALDEDQETMAEIQQILERAKAEQESSSFLALDAK